MSTMRGNANGARRVTTHDHGKRRARQAELCDSGPAGPAQLAAYGVLEPTQVHGEPGLHELDHELAGMYPHVG